MSNLRLVKEYTSPNVRQFNATDLFNEDYDVYQVEVFAKSVTGSHSIRVSMINNEGEMVGENHMDMATHIHYSNNNTGESKITAGDAWTTMLYESAEGFTSTMHFFTPYNDDKYTFAMANTSGWYNAGGVEQTNINMVGAVRTTGRCTGLKFEGNAADNIDLTLRCYGIRRD